ncbi:MAG: hypothetical protein IKZ12_04165 [Alistipes sp.]|nr:hypothetical protein [Alistipes sp.]
MKKTFFVIVVFAVLLGCYACSEEQGNCQENSLHEQQAAYDNLYAEITLLNEQFGVGETAVARSGVRRRFWKIFGADLLGGVLGCRLHPIAGFFLGVNASIIAAADTRVESDGLMLWTPSRAASYVSSTTTDSTLGMLDSLGYYHNQVICDLYDQHGEQLFSYDEAIREDLIMQAIRGYVNDSFFAHPPLAVTVKQDVTQLVNAMEADNIDAIFAAAIALTPDIENELRVVKNYCETLQYFESDEALIQYSIAHDNLIRASDLDADAQALILAGSSIGGNSAGMWDKGDGSWEDLDAGLLP